MTYAEKYNSIDWNKVPDKAKTILKDMASDTKNFKDKAATSAVGAQFDKIYARLNELGAVKEKSAAEPKTAKAQAAQSAKKSIKKPAAGKSTPTTKVLPIAEINRLAKTIRKTGETWKEAQTRAKSMIQNQQSAQKKAYGKAYLKLTALLEKDKQLAKAMKGVDKIKDAHIVASPAGKRVSRKGWKNQYGPSKGGRTYWENRANRVDYKQRKKYPFLEKGGVISRKHKAD